MAWYDSIRDVLRSFAVLGLQKVAGNDNLHVVRCPHCGTKNRVSRYSVAYDAICGKCRSVLPVPSAIRWIRIGRKHRYQMLFAVVLVGGLIAWQASQHELGWPSIPDTTHKSFLSSNPRVPEYPVIPITQGVQRVFTAAQRVAPFKIVTPSGSANYYVKLARVNDGAAVMTMYVRGGQTFETTVPLGPYRVRYAAGSNWYGTEYLFGRDTSYSEASKSFAFSQDGTGVNGYTIELIRQVGGNLHVSSISADQF